MIHAIRSPEIFILRDEADPAVVWHGFNQTWFHTSWQRRSGCGPTAVASAVYYLRRTRRLPGAEQPFSQSECRALMEDVWKYVTPTLHGIPSANMLVDGARAYFRARSLPVRADTLDIPARRQDRPAMSGLLDFLAGGLDGDMPVAFLNLNSGREKTLDSWHWVPLIRLQDGPDRIARADILDEGLVKTVNLTRWYGTTTLGGGFVRFFDSRLAAGM